MCLQCAFFCIYLLYWSNSYLELGVVEPPVLPIFEEVGVAIAVPESIVDIVRDSFPIGHRLRIGGAHRGLLLRIEFVIFGSLRITSILR